MDMNGQGNYSPNNGYSNMPSPQDNGGFLYGLLGCCVPLVGLILFIVWKNEKPKTAKACGIGALVSVICIVLFYVFVFLILGIVGVSIGGSM